MKGSEHQLIARRQRLARQLPPFEEILRGSVLTRELRCGKASCHCASGPGHLATYSSALIETDPCSAKKPDPASAQSFITMTAERVKKVIGVGVIDGAAIWMKQSGAVLISLKS